MKEGLTSNPKVKSLGDPIQMVAIAVIKSNELEPSEGLKALMKDKRLIVQKKAWMEYRSTVSILAAKICQTFSSKLQDKKNG